MDQETSADLHKQPSPPRRRRHSEAAADTSPANATVVKQDALTDPSPSLGATGALQNNKTSAGGDAKANRKGSGVANKVKRKENRFLSDERRLDWSKI